MVTDMKSNFDATIRVRVPADLMDRLDSIAKHKCKKLAEVSREALHQFADANEQPGRKKRKAA